MGTHVMNRAAMRLVAVGLAVASIALWMAVTPAPAAIASARPALARTAAMPAPIGHIGRLVTPAIPTSGGFRIYNWLAMGKCIGIANTWAGSWNCTTNPDQTWHWGKRNPNYASYAQLINGNGQCLGVDGASKSMGARIRAWTCNGNPDQWWTVVFAPADSNYIVNFNSNLVIGIWHASTANGAELVQWTENENGDQFWL